MSRLVARMGSTCVSSLEGKLPEKELESLRERIGSPARSEPLSGITDTVVSVLYSFVHSSPSWISGNVSLKAPLCCACGITRPSPEKKYVFYL